MKTFHILMYALQPRWHRWCEYQFQWKFCELWEFTTLWSISISFSPCSRVKWASSYIQWYTQCLQVRMLQHLLTHTFFTLKSQSYISLMVQLVLILSTIYVDRLDSQVLPCFFKKKKKTSEGVCCTEGTRPLFYFHYYFSVVHNTTLPECNKRFII